MDRVERRDETTLAKHRERISELLLQHHTKSEIIEIMHIEFGINLTRKQLDGDITTIQRTWIHSANINYDFMINQEIARIDALEAELWRQLRRSAEPKVREIIDRLPNRDALSDEDVDFIVAKIQTQRETVPINPVYFTKIIDVQKERRRLLGMYAPSRSEVSMHHVVEVKGYDVVSPDDWDDVIEGKVIQKVEVIENPKEELPE